MSHNSVATAALALLVAVCVVTGCTSDTVPAKPKLVLQITVDQLRADLPGRYEDRFGEGGFRWLYDNGAVFHNAHHAHANTETIVGHTTLATGAQPSAHGMIGNVWFDRGSGLMTYNIEDSAYRLLTAGADVDESTEIDPTQRAARSEGRSPAAILVPTFSDALLRQQSSDAKALGISVKDRGAVSMAGHNGLAYWFSKASGEFVTSTYYLDRYPDWVQAFNAQNPAQQFAGSQWRLLNEHSTYARIDADDREWETDVAGFGRTFPHDYGDGSSKYFTTWLTLSPAGDELVLEFAKQALVHEQLGQGNTTDFLGVSFSATDYVGHVFGPFSLEAEENLLRLDRSIARLLAAVDEQVGLDDTLVVLSADHGGPAAPGTLRDLGVESTGYVDPGSWDSVAAIERIKAQFGIDEELIDAYNHPYLYFSRAVRDNAVIDMAALEEAVVQELNRFDGVWRAYSSTALRTGHYPDSYLVNSVAHNFHPERSGDVFIVFEPNWFINDFDGLTVASTHGSPWDYDTHVPLIFAGAGIEAADIDRRVLTVDIVPTMSSLVGIDKPSGAAGSVLNEVSR